MFNEKKYLKDVKRTESIVAENNVDGKFVHMGISNAIRMINVVDVLKKSIFYGKPLNEQKLQKAMGDHSHIYDKSKYNPNAVDMRTFHAIIGLVTEAGELLEALYDPLFKGAEVDVTNIKEESGDLMYYQAILHDANDTSLEIEGKREIAKLVNRYKDGFSTKASDDRNLDAEREILETEPVIETEVVEH